MPSAPTTIHLRGAWNGPVNDPHREFHGMVIQAAAGLSAGVQVTVTYRASDHRTSGPAEHGQYLLITGGHTLHLISFTCRAARTTGPHGHDDTQEADWQAVPVPG